MQRFFGQICSFFFHLLLTQERVKFPSNFNVAVVIFSRGAKSAKQKENRIRSSSWTVVKLVHAPFSHFSPRSISPPRFASEKISEKFRKLKGFHGCHPQIGWPDEEENLRFGTFDFSVDFRTKSFGAHTSRNLFIWSQYYLEKRLLVV